MLYSNNLWNNILKYRTNHNTILVNRKKWLRMQDGPHLFMVRCLMMNVLHGDHEVFKWMNFIGICVFSDFGYERKD